MAPNSHLYALPMHAACRSTTDQFIRPGKYRRSRFTLCGLAPSKVCPPHIAQRCAPCNAINTGDIEAAPAQLSHRSVSRHCLRITKNMQCHGVMDKTVCQLCRSMKPLRLTTLVVVIGITAYSEPHHGYPQRSTREPAIFNMPGFDSKPGPQFDAIAPSTCIIRYRV